MKGEAMKRLRRRMQQHPETQTAQEQRKLREWEKNNPRTAAFLRGQAKFDRLGIKPKLKR